MMQAVITIDGLVGQLVKNDKLMPQRLLIRLMTKVIKTICTGDLLSKAAAAVGIINIAGLNKTPK